MLTVDATSPDFAGTARLVMNLDLVAEDAFGVGDTIPDRERSQKIGVVPGYSGQRGVFSAAVRGDVTLRTPSAAPAGFNLGGADALDQDFTEGFTLFLDAGQIPSADETAVAEFTVTAKAEGFTTQEIPLTVTVQRVRRADAIAAPVTVYHDASEYFGAVPTPERLFELTGQTPIRLRLRAWVFLRTTAAAAATIPARWPTMTIG